jgi:hypothetical protein
MFYLVFCLFVALCGLAILRGDWKLKGSFVRKSLFRYDSIEFPKRISRRIGLITFTWGLIFSVDAVRVLITGEVPLAGLFLIGAFFIGSSVTIYAYGYFPPESE